MLKSDVRMLLRSIEYRDWSFNVFDVGPSFALQVQFVAPDSDTGEMTVQLGRPWLLSYRDSADEVLRTAFLAVMTAEEHEARERFLVNGRAPFGPHFHVKPGSTS